MSLVFGCCRGASWTSKFGFAFADSTGFEGPKFAAASSCSACFGSSDSTDCSPDSQERALSDGGSAAAAMAETMDSALQVAARRELSALLFCPNQLPCSGLCTSFALRLSSLLESSSLGSSLTISSLLGLARHVVSANSAAFF